MAKITIKGKGANLTKILFGPFYMHTLDGRPAFYSARNQQVCFMNSYGKASQLCRSLEELRKQQKASEAWRKAKGLDTTWDMGYRRVSLPPIIGTRAPSTIVREPK